MQNTRKITVSRGYLEEEAAGQLAIDCKIQGERQRKRERERSGTMSMIVTLPLLAKAPRPNERDSRFGFPREIPSAERTAACTRIVMR